LWRGFLLSCINIQTFLYKECIKFFKGIFMKKILMIAVVLAAQLFASAAEKDDAAATMSTSRTVHFASAEEIAALPDTDHGGPSVGAKAMHTARVAANQVRILIMPDGSFKFAGRMPIGVQPWFCDVGSADHLALRGKVEIDALTEERLSIMVDFYDGLVALTGNTPKHEGAVRATVPSMPLMLINNDVHAATIVFSAPLSADPVVLQDEVARLIVSTGALVAADSNITAPGRPSVMISQLPFGTKVAGSASTVVLDLPFNTGLEGVTPTLITCLIPVAISEALLESTTKRVAAYREKLVKLASATTE
jgi:hypothetical protein